MNKLFFSLVVIFTLSSCANYGELSGIVLNDCTGYYIRHQNVDYFVCNGDFFEPKDVNQLTLVKYKKLAVCEDSVKCDAYHPYAEIIKVRRRIKK
ncbi:MAG: hypothetical protein N4A41_11585 [Crocinitomicaceae bacterium]|jgi:hypothetical protein|nr:hypothetical protein [Crocinitomicaceae bacterium]